MGRTPKIVEDRREQIIDAAMRIFAQKGFKGATNKDIAREAGITPGLIYHYFENKDALFKAIIEGRSPLRVIRSLPPATLDQPPDVLLPFLVRQVLAIVEEEQFVQLVRVFLPEVIYNPEVAPFGFEVLREAIGFVEGYLSHQIARGTLRSADPALVTQMFMGSVIGFVLRRQILRDPLVLHYTQSQIADTVVAITLQGLLPR